MGRPDQVATQAYETWVVGIAVAPKTPVAGGGFEQCFNAKAVVAAESLF